MINLPLLLTIIFFLLPNDAFSNDISSFNIDDISLEDNFSDLNGKFPCRTPDIDKVMEQGELRHIAVRCNFKDGYFTAYYNYKKRPYSIKKVFLFQDTEPDINLINKKIYSKYGKPKFTSSSKSTIKGNGILSSDNMCWGDCRVEKKDGSSWIGTSVHHGGKDKSLLIQWELWKDGYELDIELQDSIAIEELEQWDKKMELQAKKKKSNIDF